MQRDIGNEAGMRILTLADFMREWGMRKIEIALHSLNLLSVALFSWLEKCIVKLLFVHVRPSNAFAGIEALLP